MNKLITALCVAVCALPVFAADPVDVASQCAVGNVKLSWKPIKRCIVFDNEAKFKTTLEAWGWGTQPIPAIDWSKDMAVVDSDNNPYGNGVATCRGLSSNPAKKSLTLRWDWQQKIEPSAASRRKDSTEAKAPDPNAADKTMGEKAKESVTSIATDAKQAVKDIVEDAKKFPSPIPKRVAVIAVFSKALVSAKPAVDCIIQK